MRHEFGIPRTIKGDTYVYDLSKLRPLKGAKPMREYSALEACININKRWNGMRSSCCAWLNTRDRGGGFYRRTYESRVHKGPMVPTLAHVRSLAVRHAILGARMGGYQTLFVTHES